MAEQKQQARPRARKAKLVANPTPPEEIYVDGVVGIIPRPGVAKIDCFRLVGMDAKDKAELHSITHRLVMPASALPHLANLIRDLIERAQPKRGASDKK